MSHPVQHLAVLVDPQATALDADSDDQLPGYIPDPSTNNLTDSAGGTYRNPGRYIPPAGSGRVPNRHVPDQLPPPPPPVAFVSKYRNQPGTISGVTSFVLPSTPTEGNLQLVIIRTEKAVATAALVGSVTNAGLVAFNQVGGAGYVSSVTTHPFGTDLTNSLSMWWKVSQNGADDQTIRVTPGSSAVYEVIVLEYSHASSTGPVSNYARNSNAGAVNTFDVPGLALNDTTGQAVVAAMTAINAFATGLSSGYTARYGSAIGGDAANTHVIDAVGLSGVGPEAPEVNGVPLAGAFAGLACALTR